MNNVSAKPDSWVSEGHRAFDGVSVARFVMKVATEPLVDPSTCIMQRSMSGLEVHSVFEEVHCRSQGEQCCTSVLFNSRFRKS